MRIVKLSEISTFTRGLTYSKSDEVEHSNKIVLRANNIDLNTNSLNFEELRYIKDSIQIKEDKIVKKDSMIICTASGSKSHVGKVALIDKEYGYAFGGFMGQITPTDKCLPKYLYYILISEKFKDLLKSLNDGTNINNLKFSDIAHYEFSLPSLEEQREIVQKLDSAFANIDLLEENLELSEEKTCQLFQSLLSSAFSLTADENKSSNSSRDDFISPKLVSLGTLAEVIAGQSPEGIYYNSNGQGIPFYQGKKEFGDKFLGAPTTWTTKITKLAQSGDILMSVRAPVGPINFATQEICIGRGLASIRASKLINKDFLYYFLLHKQPEISGNTGAVFNSINKEQIASIELPVPSLERQQKIVERLENAFAEIELLKAQIRIKKDYAAALRQSLLSSAFTQEESVA